MSPMCREIIIRDLAFQTHTKHKYTPIINVRHQFVGMLRIWRFKLFRHLRLGEHDDPNDGLSKIQVGAAVLTMWSFKRSANMIHAIDKKARSSRQHALQINVLLQHVLENIIHEQDRGV